VPALVLVAFLAVPLIELYVILQVAHVIGGWQTLLVLVLESLLGTWLVRREGRRAWRSFQAALEAHRPPTREVADGALVVVGGTLLLTPGFLSDVLGFFFLLPLTRPLARRLLLRLAARRAGRRLGVDLGGLRGFGYRPGPPPAPRSGSVDVIEGEVVDDDPTQQARRPDLRKPDGRKPPER
jgi:UPF0716 protein FxsA